MTYSDWKSHTPGDKCPLNHPTHDRWLTVRFENGDINGPCLMPPMAWDWTETGPYGIVAYRLGKDGSDADE